MVLDSGTEAADAHRDALLDAARDLIGRWGARKTSMRDVAKAADVSRATAYRVFAGGKTELFTALAHREIAIARDEIIAAFGHGTDLADAITRALVVAARLLDDHPAARLVLDEEPEFVLPYLGFGRIGIVHRLAIDTFGPTVATRVGTNRAPWLVEWMVRVFIAHVTAPGADLDLTDADATRALVERFITPAFHDIGRSRPLSA